MKKATSKDFVSILSEDKPPLVLFRYKEEEPTFIKILNDLLKEYPLMNAYEYIIDETTDNQILADHLEISFTPVIIFYKDGNFNRYKDKKFSKKTLSFFLGSKKNYALPEKEGKAEKKETKTTKLKD